MKKLVGFFLISLLFVACSKNIEPINYGHDACEYCSMTIVDRTHAAQLVTNKGKNFKFDASECMINYLSEEGNEDKMLHLLSANYLEPGTMIDVKKSTFLISENIPSPMGAFLSVLKDKTAATDLQAESGGELFDWEHVKEEIGNLPKYMQHSAPNE